MDHLDLRSLFRKSLNPLLAASESALLILVFHRLGGQRSVIIITLSQKIISTMSWYCPLPDFPQQQQLFRAVQNDQQVAYQVLHRPFCHILRTRESQWSRHRLKLNVLVCTCNQRLSPGGTSSSQLPPPPLSAACGPCPPPRRASQTLALPPFAALNA